MDETIFWGHTDGTGIFNSHTDCTDFLCHKPRIERMTRIISDGKLFDLAETPWEQALRLFLSNKNFIHSARWIKVLVALKSIASELASALPI